MFWNWNKSCENKFTKKHLGNHDSASFLVKALVLVRWREISEELLGLQSGFELSGNSVVLADEGNHWLKNVQTNKGCGTTCQNMALSSLATLLCSLIREIMNNQLCWLFGTSSFGKGARNDLSAKTYKQTKAEEQHVSKQVTNKRGRGRTCQQNVKRKKGGGTEITCLGV